MFVLRSMIKDICRNFNLTNELSAVLKSLQAEASTMTSTAARAKADDTIADLHQFISSLSKISPSEVAKKGNIARNK